MTIIIILMILFTVLPLVLGMIVEPMRVQTMYYGFTQILQTIATRGRDAMRPLLEKARTRFKESCVSNGISGEHKYQRLFGAILLTSVATLSVYVEYKIVSITLAGIFSIKIREAGNISFDMLAGLSLTVSLIILFLILFDVAGKTNLTPLRERILKTEDTNSPILLKFIRFLTPLRERILKTEDTNSQILKFIRFFPWYSVILSGIVFGAWILISTAIIRYESHHVTIARTTELLAQAQAKPYDNLMILNRNVEKEPKTETIPKNQNRDISKAQNAATKNVMIGIPLLALLTSGLAGIGVAYLGGFLIGIIQIITTYIFIGFPYMLFSLLYTVNETLIRAVLAVISFFTDLGSAIRKRFGWAELVGPREPKVNPQGTKAEQEPSPPLSEETRTTDDQEPIVISSNFNPLA